MYTLYQLSDDNYVVAENNKAIYFNSTEVFNGMPILTWDPVNNALFPISGPLEEGDQLIISGTEGKYDPDEWSYHRAPIVIKAEQTDIRSALEKVLSPSTYVQDKA